MNVEVFKGLTTCPQTQKDPDIYKDRLDPNHTLLLFEGWNAIDLDLRIVSLPLRDKYDT